MVKLIDGVLYRQEPDQDTGDWLLAIHESLRESILSLHHDLTKAGHQGVARTKSRLKEKGFLVSNVKRCRVLCTILQCLQPERKEQGLWKGPINRILSWGTNGAGTNRFIGPLPKIA